MKILILGDIMGPSGRDALKSNLENLIKKENLNFVVVNGENSADDGLGITKSIANEFFDYGVDVITSGNHIWDKKETVDHINLENRLLRPANLPEGSPGNGFGVFLSKNNKFKIGVINLMGNVYMRKSEDVFQKAKDLREKFILKKNVDFLIVDFHGEITSEKMAIGHFFDGKTTCVVGTHTHVPTADTRILDNGTAYQTDIGMCGDYNSVIGMNTENSLKKFLREKDFEKNFPSKGLGTLSGIIVECDQNTGLAKKVYRLILGGSLTQ